MDSEQNEQQNRPQELHTDETIVSHQQKEIPKKRIGKKQYHVTPTSPSAVIQKEYANSGHSIPRRRRGRNIYHLGDEDETHSSDLDQGNNVQRHDSNQFSSKDQTVPGVQEYYPNHKSNPSICTKFLSECCSFLCPCAVLLRALCRCDMKLFWKLASSIFIIKAFWSSTISLGLCTLFRVHRVIPTVDSEGDIVTYSNSTESYLFGLWTYTNKILEDEDHSIEDFVEDEIKRLETCRFHMQKVDEDAPDGLFINDAAFKAARIFAGAVAIVGFISMVSVWLTAANMMTCCFQKRRWLLPFTLSLCAIMESFVFLVFTSSVCRDTEYNEHRSCKLQADSGVLFASIVAYLITAIGSAKLISYESNSSNTLATDDDDDTWGIENAPENKTIENARDDTISSPMEIC